MSVLPFSLTIRSGVPESDVPFWTSISLAVFVLAMVLSAPIAGWIVGKCERRQIPFFGGLSCASGATLFFMLGRKPWMIIVARIFQGASAGVVYTAGLTLLVDTIESHELGPWIGFGLSGMNFGVLVSPTLGGIVYEKAGFYHVFIMGLGVILINLVLILLIIDRRTAESYGKALDVSETLGNPGESLIEEPTSNVRRRMSSVEDGDVTATTPLLSHRSLPCTEAANYPTWWSIVGGFVRNPRIVAALYGCLINTILVSSMDAVLPIFVKQTFHWLSGAAGAIFLNLTIPSLMGPLIGMVSDRHGVRFISVIGFIFAATGVVLLTLVQRDDTVNKVLACILLFLIGKSHLPYFPNCVRKQTNASGRNWTQHFIDTPSDGDTSNRQLPPRGAA